MIADNPFRGVRNLEVPKRVERVLSADEEVKLLAACDRVRSRSLRPLVVLALNTGMRRGELLGLEWSQVDLDQRTIRILNAKSEAGRRVIPMNATVHSLLSDLAKSASSQLVFPSNRKPGEKVGPEEGFQKGRATSWNSADPVSRPASQLRDSAGSGGRRYHHGTKAIRPLQNYNDGTLCAFPCGC